MNVKQKLGIAVVVVASSLALAFVWVITNNPADAATLTSITFQGVSSTSTCSAGTGVIYYDSASGALKFCNGSTPGVFTSISTSTGGYWLATGTAIYSQSSAVAIGLNNPSATTMLQVMGADSLNTSQALVASGRTGAQFVVTNTGNVGIGTVAPGAILDISGATVRPRLSATNAGGLALFDFYSNSVARGVVGSGGAGRFYVGSISNEPVDIFQNGSAKLTVDTAGNVGIGTTAPNAFLDVNGGTLATTSGSGLELMRLSNTDSNVDNLRFLKKRNANGTDWSTASTRIQQRIDATDMGYIEFNPPSGTYGLALGTNNAERMRIDSVGNVGIGKTPATTLDVNGAIGQYGVATLQYSSASSSIAVGGLAGGLTGLSNVAIGNSALSSNTTGSNNSALGYNALNANTTGFQNAAVGASALYWNSTGYFNVAVGAGALLSNTIGYNNTANGASALYNNSTGAQNTAIGASVLVMNTTGYNNTAIGFNALYWNSTGYNNTANGVGALINNTTGASSTAVGYQALFSNTTGYQNSAVGISALLSNTTGNQNTAMGVSSLYSNATGTQNTAVGFQALYYARGSANAAFGSAALLNAVGSSNSAFGASALFSLSTGIQNNGLGGSAGSSLTTGSYNTYVGSYSGSAFPTVSNGIYLSDGQGNLRLRIDSTGAIYYGTAGTTLGAAVYQCPATSQCYTISAPIACDGHLQIGAGNCTANVYDSFNGVCNVGTAAACSYVGRLTP